MIGFLSSRKFVRVWGKKMYAVQRGFDKLTRRSTAHGPINMEIVREKRIYWGCLK